MKLTRAGFLLLLIAGGALLSTGRAAERERIVKSVIFPGMGQLGDDQTVKGLCFMGAEAVFLTLTFNELSHLYSYSYDTRRLQIRYKMAKDYAELENINAQWNDDYNKTKTARLSLAAYGCLAAVCWGLNIADAALLPPKGSNAEADLIRKLPECASVFSDGERTGISFAFDF